MANTFQRGDIVSYVGHGIDSDYRLVLKYMFDAHYQIKILHIEYRELDNITEIIASKYYKIVSDIFRGSI